MKNSIYFMHAKKLHITLAICLLISIWLTQSVLAQTKTTTGYKIETVVLDAGHGGKDPGALGKKSQEKELTLALALKVGKYIEKEFPHVKVIYTRKTDEFIELKRRAEIANLAKADLFISIHINANKKKTLYGTSTYVMGVNKSAENIELAKLENSVIAYESNYAQKYDGYEPDAPETHIIMSLVQNVHLEQSLLMAKLIQDQFRIRAGRNDMGVRQAALVVLWQTTMPAVLVEAGYITNETEEKYLMSAQGQDFLASAIFRAFKEYKQKIEAQNKKIVVNKNVPTPRELADTSLVNFGVQIRSSVKQISLNSNELKGFAPIKEVVYGGRYNYIVGNINNYEEALTLQSEIRKKIPDAFLVAFKNKKKISIQTALDELKKQQNGT